MFYVKNLDLSLYIRCITEVNVPGLRPVGQLCWLYCSHQEHQNLVCHSWVSCSEPEYKPETNQSNSTWVKPESKPDFGLSSLKL